MQFKKLVKAEDFDAKKEELKDYATHQFYKALEGVVYWNKKEGLSKEDILSCLEEATIHLEEVFDEINL